MDFSDSFYTKFSKSYDRYAEDKKAYLQAVNSFVVQNLPQGLRVVDIGSGNGNRARDIADACRAASLLLLDNSEGMISLARRVPGATVLKADISSGAFANSTKYQAALCLWNVVGHISDEKVRLTALKNIYSLLEPGGLLFLDVNNRYNAAHYGFSSVARNIAKDVLAFKDAGDFSLEIDIEGIPTSTTVHIFSPGEIKRLVKKAGFRIVKKERIDYRTGERKRGNFSGQLAYMLIRP